MMPIANTGALRAHELSSLARARQIAAVLARHHLWHLIELMALEHMVPIGRDRPVSGQASKIVAPEDLRLALEELGPTFMKLGQVLSTRADLLPPEFQTELARLQDRAPVVPAEAIVATIEAELGKPVESAYANFDRTPLATGSIGQAHLATFADGTEVVVKVRRPGAVEQIDEDLKLLHRLAAIASSRLGGANGWDLVGVVREFDSSLREELDYLREGHNAERFEENFKRSPHVHIPQVFWNSTTSRVLTMEKITGSRITDDPALRNAGIDRDQVASNVARIVLKMLLEDGFFHADLHPGNLFIEGAKRIGLIDFGMVGAMDERARAGLAQLLMALARRDSDAMVDGLVGLGMADPKSDRPALKKDLEHLASEYYDRAIGEANLEVVFNDVFSVLRAHKLVMPSTLSMLAKTLITAEGMVAQLDPKFRMIDATEPYVMRMVVEENSPLAWTKRFGRAAPDVLWLATESPRILRRAVGSLDRGELALAVEPKGLEPLVHRVENAANRIVLGIVIAALVVAIGFVVTVYRPGASGGLVGTFLAGALGAGAVVVARLLWLATRKPPR